MKTLTKIFLFVLLLLTLTNCYFFETRQPADPNSDSGDFLPPTSPQIVVENLLAAFSAKNADNYGQCFVVGGYTFTPSMDAVTNFGGVFSNWNEESEKRYLRSLSSQLGEYNTLSIEFESTDFETINSDSAVLITNYICKYSLRIAQFPMEYQGKVVLTIVPLEAGTWAIRRWQDFALPKSEFETISHLKAYFY